MAGLTTGTIPPQYRDIYEMICPTNSTKVPKGLWLKVIATGKITETTAEEIFNMCDTHKSNKLGRDSVYKSLALVALAQQGKPLDDKVLSNYADKEFPIPSLGGSGDIREICARYIRATNPTELAYTYEELKALDDIQVTLVPEKKGTLLKHNEYVVESRYFSSSVQRRYKDFEGFHHILLTRYPFRLVPLLPPKVLLNNSERFVEQRRRGLKRYLTLICHHPVLIRDECVRYFFTASGNDVGARIKERYKNTADEFLFNPLATAAKELVTDSTRMKYERVKDQISLMVKIVTNLLRIAHNMEERTLALSDDMRSLNKELTALSGDSILSTPWTSGTDDSWSIIQRDCRRAADEFTILGDRARTQADKEAKTFSESVHLFLDLLSSYQDLCLRREKLGHRKHQKALNKVHTYEKFKGHLEAQGKTMTEKQENKFQKNDDELIMIEQRNFFSLFCLDMEAQLIHSNLSQIPEMLATLVHTQVDAHDLYLRFWTELQPMVDAMCNKSHPKSNPPSLGGASSPFS